MHKTRPFHTRVFALYTFECTIHSLVSAASNGNAAFLTAPSIHALYYAVDTHNTECVDALISLGVDVNEHPNRAVSVPSANNTPLESALENCDMDITRSLLQAGAKITKGTLTILVSECGDRIVNMCLEYMNK